MKLQSAWLIGAFLAIAPILVMCQSTSGPPSASPPPPSPTGTPTATPTPSASPTATPTPGNNVTLENMETNDGATRIWRLDDPASATSIAELLGSGDNLATPSPTPTYQVGPIVPGLVGSLSVASSATSGLQSNVTGLGNSTPFSLRIVLNPGDTSVAHTLFSTGAPTGTGNLGLEIDEQTTGLLKTQIGTGAGYSQLTASAYPLTLGQTSSVTFVYTGTGETVYVNGNSVSTGTAVLSPSGSNGLRWMRAYSSGTGFIGTAAEMAYFPGVALTSAQVIALASAAPTPTPAPTATPSGSLDSAVTNDGAVAYYKMNDTGSSMVDAIGGTNGVYGSSVTHPATTNYITSSAITPATFGGDTNSTAQVAALASGQEPTSAITVEAWVNVPLYTSGLIPVATYGTTACSGAVYALCLNSGLAYWHIQTSSGGNFTTSALLTAGVHHLVGTYDSSVQTMDVYVDGILSGTASTHGTLPYAQSGFAVGSYPSGNASTSTLTGSVNNVAIYPTALTAAQIENHFVRGWYTPTISETPAANATFLNSIGYNTELSFGIYSSNFSTVSPLLYAAGPKHVREGRTTTSTYYSQIQTWCSNGITPEFVTGTSASNALESASDMQSYNTNTGQCSDALEGPNEPSLSSDPNKYSDTYQTQQNISSLTSAGGDANFTAKLNIGPSYVGGFSSGVAAGDLTPYVVYCANGHYYTNTAQAGFGGSGSATNVGIYGSFDYNSGTSNTLYTSPKPICVTEAGYGTSTNASGAQYYGVYDTVNLVSGHTIAAGDTATITIAGTAVTYTAAAGDTPTTVATGLAAAANANSTLSNGFSISSSGAQVTANSTQTGAATSFTNTESTTGGNMTISASGPSQAVSLDAQRKLVAQQMFYYWQRGVLRQFYFNFLDTGTNGAIYTNFGVVDSAFNPKPSYYEVQSIFATLADSSSVTPAPLSYRLSGNVANVIHDLYQKSDGSYWLALFQNVPIWNTVTNVENSNASEAVTLTTTNSFTASTTTFKASGNATSAPIAGWSGTSGNVNVTDDITLVHLVPGTPSPTPSPTPTPTATPTSTPTPTAAPTGLANAAYSGYVTPAPTSYPAAMPTDALTVALFYDEIQPNPNITPNPFPSPLAVSYSGGADISCTLQPRIDNAATGYLDTCVNAGATAEPVSFTVNQKTAFDSFDTQSNINDSASGFCPSYTPLTYNDGSFHTCAIVITVAAGNSINFTGSNAMQPGAVRFFHLNNGTASTAASPTPVPAVTPTAAPTQIPVAFPGDYPPAYQANVNALIVPVPYQTIYPYTSGPTVNAGGKTSGFESFQYVNSAGEVLYMPYFPQPSATPNTFQFSVTGTQPGAGAAFIATTALLPTPTSSPCTYGQQGLVLAPSPNPNSTGSANSYGICVPSIIQFEASAPSPNPSPTYSAYPGMLDTTCGASGTYLSQAGGPYPPASRQCMFLKNPMVGIIPSNATIDPNDSSYMSNSGVGNGPAPVHVVGTIAGSPQSDYAYDWVTNGSPSIPLNMTCSGTCGTVGKTPVFVPQDLQVQAYSDCHAELVDYTLGYVEDFWQVNLTNAPACTGPVYQGAAITASAGTRLPFNSDGTHSFVTASEISPGIGMIRGQDVLDARVSTFPTAIQIAPPCTNAAWRPPAFGSDKGAGSTCNGIQPPDGAEIGLFETPAHVLSCGLDVLSQKWWLTLTVGFGHGAFISDTNGGGSSSYYIQTETDRDMTRFGVASSWQLIAKMMGVAISGDGTYSLPISTGSGCINTADIHFISPSTPNVQGTTLAP